MEMAQYKAEFHLKPEGLGGQFAGNSIHKIISEEGLQGLRKFIQDKEVIEPVIEYLRSIRILYQMSVAEKLDPKYDEVINVYCQKFMALYNNDKIRLMETPKCHILRTHLAQYFKETQQTLYTVSDSYCETTHQALSRSELTHRLKTRNNLGSKAHRERQLYSTCIYNFVRLGFTHVDLTVLPLPDYTPTLDHDYCA